jgi:microcystin-dependent protein
LCNGQAVSRTTYFNLYAAIGTQYGQGDNSTTFNVPDYQGMFLRGRVDIPASVSGSGTPTTNNATFTGHGIKRNGFKVRFTSVGTLTGVVINTDYYAIVVDSSTLAFAATLANATAGTPTKIVLGGTNNAVIAQWEDPDASSRLQAATGANGGMSVGSLQADAMQGHAHGSIGATTFAGTGGGSSVMNRSNLSPSAITTTVTGAITDGVNGTPRTSTESRPKNISINYIIKT